ncbi:hypothetical protein [Nonomuraea roseola]|uniref:Uncharacterized protein n=1 Tax=Nonomuraea roseola TaxID=46179 RepID=A0ABV5QDR2_9ACTN
MRAALEPVVGADRVTDVLGRIAAATLLQPAQVNGCPALVFRLNGEIDTVMAVRIDDGLITPARSPHIASRGAVSATLRSRTCAPAFSAPGGLRQGMKVACGTVVNDRDVHGFRDRFPSSAGSVGTTTQSCAT